MGAPLPSRTRDQWPNCKGFQNAIDHPPRPPSPPLQTSLTTQTINMKKVHEPRDDEGNVVEHDAVQLQVDKMERLLTVADTKPVSV